ELGDTDGAVDRLRKCTALELPQDDLLMITVELMLALILSSRPDRESQAEARSIARARLPRVANMPWIAALAHEALARVALAEGNGAEAEAEARAGCDAISFAPVFGLQSLETLARALLAQGKAGEACHVSEQGLTRIRSVGCAGSYEVP